jgi:Phage terminase large subunit gpA, ATPase domain
MNFDAKTYAESLADIFPVEVIEEALTEMKPPTSLGSWAEGTPIILDGNPFSFKGHGYLKQIYFNPHAYEVHIKATQLGLTVYGISRSVFSLRFRGFLGVLYLFPSRNDVADFSRSRVKTLILENPNTIGRWLQDTDNIGLKRVHNGDLYLRGMVSRVGLKSVPVDMVVFDELDEARDQSAVDMAIERMAHSEFKEVLMLSNPSLPDFGIDRAFQETDQNFWLLKCPGCGRWCNLVDEFPECLVELKDRTIRACVKCGHELDISAGEWVPKKPRVTDRKGYQHSQLHSAFVDPKELLRKFRSARTLTNFYNLNLGLAYVEAENRLSVQEVLALCGDEGIVSEDPGPCTMGVDQGKDLHVVIGKRHPVKEGQIVHLGIYKDWQELDRLMKNFNVSRCVVDGLPEQRNARSFADRFKGRVFLNFYNIHQKHDYAWDEKKLTVSSGRTESLDASHMEIANQEIVLPRESDIVREFAEHLHNVAKKLEEDKETGSKRYVYLKLGEDHFRHSYNYWSMARTYGKGGLFYDLF